MYVITIFIIVKELNTPSCFISIPEICSTMTILPAQVINYKLVYDVLSIIYYRHMHYSLDCQQILMNVYCTTERVSISVF